MAKRQSYSLDFQRKVIDAVESGKKSVDVAAEFNVNPTQVCRWLKNKTEISNLTAENGNLNRKITFRNP